MGHYREPEPGTLTVGYLLIALSLPALLAAAPGAVLATSSNWWVFALLEGQSRVWASILFALIAGISVMALIVGVQSISDKHVEGDRPLPKSKPLAHMRRPSGKHS